MKIQVLEYFVTLAESKSISEAAQKLYIAQPSLSKSLQLMEKEIGCSLFLRTETGIHLTDAGKKILPEAKQVLNYYQGWKSLAHQPTLRQIEIYTTCSFPDFIMPKAILQVSKHYPDLSIDYSLCNHPEKYISRSTKKPVLALFTCLNNEEIDKYTQLQGNAPLILLQGAYYCLVNARSPLAKLHSVNAELLKDAYLVLPGGEDKVESYPPSDIISTTIISATPHERTIYVATAANVIDLVSQDPETFAVSYYPALKRYTGVARGELIPIPFHGHSLCEPLVLAYSKQAYAEHAEVRELVQNIETQIKCFPP